MNEKDDGIMTDMFWLNSHLNNINDGVKLINKLMWGLEITYSKDYWYVTTGVEEKHILLKTHSRDVVNVFIYGMGLAYAGLPEHLLKKLQVDLEEWMEQL